jgi:hypothetical protein
MIHCDLAGLIQQNQRRGGGSAVFVEVGFADGDRHVEQSGIEAVADGVDVGHLVAGRSVLDLGRVAIKPGWSDNRQAFGCELRAKLGEDRSTIS